MLCPVLPAVRCATAAVMHAMSCTGMYGNGGMDSPATYAKHILYIYWYRVKMPVQSRPQQQVAVAAGAASAAAASGGGRDQDR